MLRIILFVLALLVLLAVGYWIFVTQIGNPRVAREIMDNPTGERAARVMLLTLPGGRTIPVNYLREDDMVYAGADGSWWKELVGDGKPVTVLVRGETLSGEARVVLDDPEYVDRIFLKLRPNAVKGFGTLVEVSLEGGGAGARRSFASWVVTHPPMSDRALTKPAYPACYRRADPRAAHSPRHRQGRTPSLRLRPAC